MTPQTTGWNELRLAEDPAVELLQSLGYTYVPPEDLDRERASFKEPILTGRLTQALKRLNPWLSGPNLTNAARAVTQVPAASLAEANQALYTSLTYGIALEQDRGDGRKSHTVRFLDFDKPEPQRVGRHPAVQGPRGEEARHPRCRRLRQRPAAGGHRVQEPDHRRRLEGRSGQAAPPLPRGRLALEGPGCAEAVRGGADPRGHLRGARRLRHGRHAGAVLSRVEGAVSSGRGAARRAARASAYAAGHPALRATRAAQPPRHRPELCGVRGRRRPRGPQADPLQAVHRRQRGDAADPDGAGNRALGAASSGTPRGRARA